MQGIEKVKITLRKGDWWYSLIDGPMPVNPQGYNSNWEQIRADWKTEAESSTLIPWNR